MLNQFSALSLSGSQELAVMVGVGVLVGGIYLAVQSLRSKLHEQRIRQAQQLARVLTPRREW